MIPSDREQEYFLRRELERKTALERERHEKLKQEEKKKLKALHHMHCPKCGMGLIEIDYRNIKVDKCSACGGIWLDEGELEQVVDLNQKGLGKFLGFFADRK